MNFRKYLQARIKSLEKQHLETKETEAKTDNSVLRLSYNSHAASLFAVKYELELALNEYDRCEASNLAEVHTMD